MKLCAYCNTEPVAPEYTDTCAHCTFTCERCKKPTPYEKGMAYDELCDDCGVAVDEHLDYIDTEKESACPKCSSRYTEYYQHTLHCYTCGYQQHEGSTNA